MVAVWQSWIQERERARARARAGKGRFLICQLGVTLSLSFWEASLMPGLRPSPAVSQIHVFTSCILRHSLFFPTKSLSLYFPPQCFAKSVTQSGKLGITHSFPFILSPRWGLFPTALSPSQNPGLLWFVHGPVTQSLVGTEGQVKGLEPVGIQGKGKGGFPLSGFGRL